MCLSIRELDASFVKFSGSTTPSVSLPVLCSTDGFIPSPGSPAPNCAICWKPWHVPHTGKSRFAAAMRNSVAEALPYAVVWKPQCPPGTISPESCEKDAASIASVPLYCSSATRAPAAWIHCT